MEEHKASSSSDERSSKRQATVAAKKELNAARGGQSLWLVKIPQFVAEAWADAKQDDVLGSLMVGVKPGKEGTKQMIIKLDKREGHEIPEQYTLDEMKTSAGNDGTMMAFNIDNESKQFALEGTVTKSLVLKPPISNEYQSMVQRRGATAAANRREVAIVDPKELEKASKQSCTIEFLSSVRGEIKRKGGGGKDGVAVDTSALKTKMFEAFELDTKQPFDTILTMCREVAGFSREQDLRDMLDKYAIYHHKGPYRTMWELKTQYRDQTDETKGGV